MTNKQKYYINRGMFFLAVAYALNGYQMPSMICSIVSILLTNEFIGWRHLKSNLNELTLMSAIMAFMIKMTVRLDGMIYVFILAAVAGVIFSSQWVRWRYAITSAMMRSEVILLAGFVLIACVLPVSFAVLTESMVVIAIVFMPLIASYIFRHIVLKEYINPLDKEMKLR